MTDNHVKGIKKTSMHAPCTHALINAYEYINYNMTKFDGEHMKMYWLLQIKQQQGQTLKGHGDVLFTSNLT